MAPAIVIEAGTGAIQLGAPNRLLPWETLRAIEPRVTDLIRHRQDFGTSYEWLYLQHLSFGDYPAHVGLCFAHGRLEMLNFSVSLPGTSQGWPSQADIDAEIEFVRETLAGMIGFDPVQRAMAFTWGSVWSDHDPKAGLASSGLRYNQ